MFVSTIRALIAVGMRLGREAKPSLAWHCRDFAEMASAWLAEHFPGAE